MSSLIVHKLNLVNIPVEVSRQEKYQFEYKGVSFTMIIEDGKNGSLYFDDVAYIGEAAELLSVAVDSFDVSNFDSDVDVQDSDVAYGEYMILFELKEGDI